MKISIVIPTYQNQKLWQQWFLMDSLLHQRVLPHELLIADDGSTDGTAEFLADVLRGRPFPFPVRLFRRAAPRTLDGGGPGLAENYLFSQMTGDACLHLDADGFVSHDLLEFVHTLDPTSCYWGRNVFIADTRHNDPRLEHYRTEGIHEMLDHELHAYGALWMAPAGLIRNIGGHDMALAEYRGQDSRMGARLRMAARCYFVNLPGFRFYHYGIPTQHTLLHRQQVTGEHGRDARYKAAQDMKRFRATHRLPQLGNYRPTLVENHGPAVWQSPHLLAAYEEIGLSLVKSA